MEGVQQMRKRTDKVFKTKEARKEMDNKALTVFKSNKVDQGQYAQLYLKGFDKPRTISLC